MTETIERIHALMRAKNMSLMQVARKGGIDKSTVSNILSGKRANPRARSLEKIAFALDTTLDYLLTGEGNQAWRASPPLPDFGLDVLEAMRSLPKVRNYQLLVIARSFIESRAQINALAVQEFRDLLLDAGDEIMGESATNELMRRLDLLIDRDNAGNSSAPGSSSGPDAQNQPGDDVA